MYSKSAGDGPFCGSLRKYDMLRTITTPGMGNRGAVLGVSFIAASEGHGVRNLAIARATLLVGLFLGTKEGSASLFVTDNSGAYATVWTRGVGVWRVTSSVCIGGDAA